MRLDAVKSGLAADGKRKGDSPLTNHNYHIPYTLAPHHRLPLPYSKTYHVHLNGNDCRDLAGTDRRWVPDAPPAAFAPLLEMVALGIRCLAGGFSVRYVTIMVPKLKTPHSHSYRRHFLLQSLHVSSTWRIIKLHTENRAVSASPASNRSKGKAFNMKASLLALAAISTLVSATNLFVSDYAGLITTFSLTSKNGSYCLEKTSETTGCAPNPSWLTIDPAHGLLYCLNEGLESKNGSISSFIINTNGSLTFVKNETVISGPVSGIIHGQPAGPRGLAVRHITTSLHFAPSPSNRYT
jgi:hypothetical protein